MKNSLEKTSKPPKDSSNYNNMDSFAYELKIPLERVAVLIGKEGETKNKIEEMTQSRLNISPEGDVAISGEDGFMLYTTKEIVLAIARGFNPNTALMLLKTDYALEIINLRDIAGKSKNTLERLKGRIIGKGGKAREEIERLTSTKISVYGKTVGIIGEAGEVTLAREAAAMLLQGSMHKTVFQFLERKKKQALFG